jgi:hypothetical protein
MTIEDLLRHISRCPLGWHEGRVIRTRMTTEQDVIDWLQKLEELRHRCIKIGVDAAEE